MPASSCKRFASFISFLFMVKSFADKYTKKAVTKKITCRTKKPAGDSVKNYCLKQ
jgi:hypothetical protein